jgi:hypothetical protein
VIGGRSIEELVSLQRLHEQRLAFDFAALRRTFAPGDRA